LGLKNLRDLKSITTEEVLGTPSHGVHCGKLSPETDI
jgi:hypothetical protein